MLTISAPASSANLGPGFDSVGMAVNLNLILHVEKADKWSFTHTTDFVPPVSNYHDHYIYKIATHIANLYGKSLSPCKVTMHSEIPLARGLGSSASAIVVGIELANQLCKLNLSQTEKLKCAVNIEGHPDNVAPALLGGIVISTKVNEHVYYKRITSLNCDTVIYIPNFKLKTEDARKVLPKNMSLSDAASASGVANLLIAALLTDDYKLAGTMMEHDYFHEQYRAKLIPNYDKIKQKSKEHGAYGTVISGAGPTMISFVPKGTGNNIVSEMKQYLPNYTVKKINLDNKGLQVKNNI